MDELKECFVDEYGRKEMFYLTMHSIHFIFGYMALWTYGKGPFR